MAMMGLAKLGQSFSSAALKLGPQLRTVGSKGGSLSGFGTRYQKLRNVAKAGSIREVTARALPGQVFTVGGRKFTVEKVTKIGQRELQLTMRNEKGVEVTRKALINNKDGRVSLLNPKTGKAYKSQQRSTAPQNELNRLTAKQQRTAKRTGSSEALNNLGVGVIGKHFVQDPALATAMTAGTAAFGVELFGPPTANALSGLKSGITGDYPKEIKTLLAERRQNLYMQSRQQRLQRDINTNVAQIAYHMPHRYNELVAGRPLPQGAVVFGGQGRPDVLEMAAHDMALGAYDQPDPEAQLMASLGL